MRIVPAICLVACGAALAAAENPDHAAEEVEAAGPWTFEGTAGAFVRNVAVRNTHRSRDATIAGSSETASYLLQFDGAVTWRVEPNAVEQTLVARFGREKPGDAPWRETTDEFDYDGTYKRILPDPHYVFAGWGIDSVFTGVLPDEEPADPTRGKVSVGYGQAFTWEEPHERSWEWRVGARAQRNWGRGLGADGREIETGIEFWTRYEDRPLERLGFWAQFEAFSEFEDPGHISNLLTAAFDYQLAEYLSLKLTLRAYYETEPEDADPDAEGFDVISVRQETLLGATYTF